MRTISLTTSLLILFTIHLSNAQNLDLGAGVGYGNHIQTPVFNFRAFYTLNNGIQIGPDFQFSLGNKGSSEFIDFSTFRRDYSLMGRYVFEGLNFIDKTKFYPIIGLSLVRLKAKGSAKFSNNPALQVSEAPSSFFGALVGLGAQYELNKAFRLYGEIRYHASEIKQTIVNVGIIYPVTLPFAKKD